MKYKAIHYAEALVRSLNGASPETASARIRVFIVLLRKHRMLGKAGIITRLAERKLAKEAGVSRVTLETPESAPEALRKEVADIFGGKVWMQEKVQPGFLAGVRILIDDETLVDATGARRLARMFCHAA